MRQINSSYTLKATECLLAVIVVNRLSFVAFAYAAILQSVQTFVVAVGIVIDLLVVGFVTSINWFILLWS